MCKFRWKPKLQADVEARQQTNAMWWQNERLRRFYREPQQRANARQETPQPQQQQQASQRHPLAVHPMAEVQMNGPSINVIYFLQIN